jgi:thiosulfate/3-mercaptopyruvate sulfurtransferase
MAGKDFLMVRGLLHRLPAGRLAVAVLFVAVLLCSRSLVAQAPPAPDHVPAAIVPQEHLVQPEAFAAELKAGTRGQLILQVGSRVLFDQAHSPGAQYAGPTARPEGLNVLGARVENLPLDKPIVLYCGCCPWIRCPNIGPAWTLLHDMGFTNVRVLYLADNFGANWVTKGYPSEPSN